MFSSCRQLPLVSVLLCGVLVLLGACPAFAQETPKAPAAESPADPYAVPEKATPAELAAFIEKILSEPPRDSQARDKAMQAMVQAADKIFGAPKAEDSALETAVQIKLLFTHEPKELAALADKLQAAGKAALARQLRQAMLSARLRAALQANPDEMAAEVKKVIGEVKGFLSQGPLDQEGVGLAMSAGRVAEMTGDEQLAADTYTDLSKMFGASDDPRIANLGKTLEGVIRRLKLVGNTMQVEGALLGGDKLDWAKYRGKVVLVDFWATWCGPCVGEVPNLLKAYGQYHDLGFDIVGISLDRSREALEKFIDERKIPWSIVFDDNGRNVTAEYYGVMGIPTMILVGADGKVVSTQARGEALFELLEKLLGPPKPAGGAKPAEGAKPEGTKEQK